MFNINGVPLIQSRFAIATVVYFALLLDNILLTVIVPILPDYLARIDNTTEYTVPQSIAYKNFDLHYVPTIISKHPIPGKSLINFTIPKYLNDSNIISDNNIVGSNIKNLQSPLSSSLSSITSAVSVFGMTEKQQKITKVATDINRKKLDALENENGSIGLLLGMKALVQLIFNPIVGSISIKYGYRILVMSGTFCLLLSSIVFCIGETYVTLLFARALQGIGSACIGVCGMSLVAQLYPEDSKRSKVMGIILGSIALGVLVGYPFGGILYDFVGKSAPFLILSFLLFGLLLFQILCVDLTHRPEIIYETDRPKWKPILQNRMVIAIVIAIWLSTSTMAILEPCLPIWLIENLHPKKWQLGTVFIPDSIGYFIGTNFFGTIAYNFGQIKISCLSLFLIGIACIIIPSATTVYRLLLPHFALGLGIGIIDAALTPLLATFVDLNSTANDDDSTTTSDSMSNYGTVYAVQQTSVSLAYCLAPLIGGELATAIGFAWLIRSVGLLNLIYAPILLSYYKKKTKGKNDQLLSVTGTEKDSTADYKRLYNTLE